MIHQVFSVIEVLISTESKKMSAEEATPDQYI